MSAQRDLLPDDLFSQLPKEPDSGVRLNAKVLTLDEFAARVIPKRAAPVTKSTIEDARAEVETMCAEQDWSRATARHLVALYECLYRVVYGYRPTELQQPKVWTAATAAAGRMLEHQFANRISEAIAFLYWAWKREEATEKWRRENHRDGAHMGWRFQFGDALVDRYRVSTARTAAR